MESNRGVGGRLTFQATRKDKFTFSWDKQRNLQDQLTGQLETGTVKNEGNAGYCQRHEVIQGTWSRPQSSNILFDGGITFSKFNFGGFGKDLLLSDYEGCGGGIRCHRDQVSDRPEALSDVRPDEREEDRLPRARPSGHPRVGGATTTREWSEHDQGAKRLRKPMRNSDWKHCSTSA